MKPPPGGASTIQPASAGTTVGGGVDVAVEATVGVEVGVRAGAAVWEAEAHAENRIALPSMARSRRRTRGSLASLFKRRVVAPRRLIQTDVLSNSGGLQGRLLTDPARPRHHGLVAHMSTLASHRISRLLRRGPSWSIIGLVLVLVAFVEGGSYVASQGKSAVDLMLSDLNVRPSWAAWPAETELSGKGGRSITDRGVRRRSAARRSPAIYRTWRYPGRS